MLRFLRYTVRMDCIAMKLWRKNKHVLVSLLNLKLQKLQPQCLVKTKRVLNCTTKTTLKERDDIHVTFILKQWTLNDTGLNCADLLIHVLSFPVNTHYSIPQSVDTICWILIQNHRLAGLTVKLYADFWLQWGSASLMPIYFKSQLSVVTLFYFIISYC